MSTHNYEYIETPNKPIKAWIKGVPLEDEARKQLLNVASLPFIYSHVAVMPDVHWGKGATVGSVIATDGAIIPAAVGVDIGCGMMAVETSIRAEHLPDNLHSLRVAIEEAIPHGRTDNGGPNDKGSWGDTPEKVTNRWNSQKLHRGETLEAELKKITDKHPKIGQANDLVHFGTLGTGNHFIELCLDERGYLWVMLHSGSRGIGNRIGTYFIELAKKEMSRWFINLPDKDLAYLAEGSEYFYDYVQAVGWAQSYARANRELMMEAILDILEKRFENFSIGKMVVNCHHNYVNSEEHGGKKVWVTRKGAVRAGDGEYGIIPGSMGAKSYIVKGKGNRESFCTCSHGAGRRMSRGEANKQITLEEHEKATAGVECRKDAGVLDESPRAYKDIDAVMAAQSDLIEIVHTLKQVVNVKG